ncbi:carbon starvation CstA family protein [Schlesneria paludicola]|uniref:carbon starvation CstA family protein n=1 Tax=Schlesneria paludicola TaxID=360056 RepID=UPI000492D501|nr:carbon starvation CstA family protein [Schlesneria paludicola]
MSMLVIVLASAAILSVAYLTYGPLLVRLLKLDPKAQTPAYELRDDVDYAPLAPNELLSQHFSAIAAAGPIVGPILAGVMFGWLPALIWILVGSILIGGVHDFTALVASIRHKARSIAEVVRDHMSRRAFVLFLSFVWLALVYIIVAFTDVTAASFVGTQTLENGETVTGAGIASSSLMYLALPIIMGLLQRYAKLSVGWAIIIFLPMVGVSIWAGQYLPVDMTAMLKLVYPAANDAMAHKTWDFLLLAYCCVASVVPMWLLLQPRGHLGGYFLYVALAAGAVGLLFGGAEVKYPYFNGWTTAKGETLFPVLFITIACGACSGFHSLIASGTTSKQLRYETDARVIGYGAMLLEAMVAIVSLSCVMILAKDAPLLKDGQPNLIYAQGIGALLEQFSAFVRARGWSGFHLSSQLTVSFALMAFTTFVYDTLDVCTRLGRYIIQELTGWHDAKGRWMGTLLTAGVPVFFVMQSINGVDGKPAPLWRVFWALFGASNQLLAALTLLGVTVWLWQTRRELWVLFVVGLPTVFMYTMSTWALGRMIYNYVRQLQGPTSPQQITYVLLGISILLLVLALAMLVEAVMALTRSSNGGSRPNAPTPAMVSG